MRLQRQTGLVGHWKFKEKSGTVANDSSRYRNTGTITVGAGKWTDKGYYLDGAATYVDCGSNDILKFGTIPFSVCAWVYPFTLSNKRIISKYGNTGGDYIFSFDSSGYPGFLRWTGTSNNYELWTSSIAPVTRVFQHVSFSYNGTNAVLYINSISGVNTKTTGTLTASSTNTQIGRGGTQYFLGNIDDVCIYNRALSAGEISQYYNATKHKYI